MFLVSTQERLPVVSHKASSPPLHSPTTALPKKSQYKLMGDVKFAKFELILLSPQILWTPEG
jgi:hypothetical protein